MMNPDVQPRVAFRLLRIIFYALNTGVLIFFLVAVYLNGMSFPPFRDDIDILTVVNVFLLAAIPVGYTLSNRRMEAINPKDPFHEKWEQFQSAMILRWAMIEGTALFSIVGLILLNDAKQLVLLLLCLLVLAFNSVSREKVARMAKLNAEEEKALED